MATCIGWDADAMRVGAGSVEQEQVIPESKGRKEIGKEQERALYERGKGRGGNEESNEEMEGGEGGREKVSEGAREDERARNRERKRETDMQRERDGGKKAGY